MVDNVRHTFGIHNHQPKKTDNQPAVKPETEGDKSIFGGKHFGWRRGHHFGHQNLFGHLAKKEVEEGQTFVKENASNIKTNDDGTCTMDSETAENFFKTVQIDNGEEGKFGNGTDFSTTVVEKQIEELKAKIAELTPAEETPVVEEVAVEEPTLTEETPVAEEVAVEEPTLTEETPVTDEVAVEEPTLTEETPVEKELTQKEATIADKPAVENDALRNLQIQLGFLNAIMAANSDGDKTVTLEEFQAAMKDGSFTFTA